MFLSSPASVAWQCRKHSVLATQNYPATRAARTYILYAARQINQYLQHQP